ncbi:MAG: hypothetical protein MSH30_02710 [Campylobacter sp.]|nr:hypothetical protein [Campylobacter sp.]MCI7464050.1 hypothetical protein [Campylobacter sp.]
MDYPLFLAAYIVLEFFGKGLAKKTFLWLFVILPIIVALYTFAPTFLAVGLAVFILIGAIASVDKSAKSFRLKKL